ncbi:MAG TPA: phage major capsid protein [Verrucomicrobiota bacterium]|nr:phage major capsid protein [Verrucomicrobiota bacterium]HQL80047.1 phage major capsid protein [Verrucomicrobiota bacterium]
MKLKVIDGNGCRRDYLERLFPVDLNARSALDKLGRGQMQEVARRLGMPAWAPGTKTAVTTGTGVGAGSVPDEVAALIINLAQTYGAFRTLNVRPAPSGKTTFPVAKLDPGAVGEAPFITPANQGGQLTPVSKVLGTGLETEARELPILVDVANALLDDDRADLGAVLADLFAAAIARRIEWAAFSADGTDDQQDGGQTGIFAHGDVPAVTAAAGHRSVELLQEEDLLKAMDAVADAAQMRRCRWWMHPTHFLKLLRVKDGSGARLVTSEEGEPFLVGRPVTLVASAPSATAAGSKVIAYGCGDAYLVALREELKLVVSDEVKFDCNIRQFRATARVFCGMLDASWFSTLALAES